MDKSSYWSVEQCCWVHPAAELRLPTQREQEPAAVPAVSPVQPSVREPVEA